MTPERLSAIRERAGWTLNDWFRAVPASALTEPEDAALTYYLTACCDLLAELDRLREAITPLVAKVGEFNPIPGYTPPRLVHVALADLRRAAVALATPHQSPVETRDGGGGALAPAEQGAANGTVRMRGYVSHSRLPDRR